MKLVCGQHDRKKNPLQLLRNIVGHRVRHTVCCCFSRLNAMPAFCNLQLSLLFPLPCAHPIDFMSSRLCSLAVANSNLSKKLSHSGVRARSDALTGCSHSRVPTPRSRPMRCCNSPNHFFALQLHLHWRVPACRAAPSGENWGTWSSSPHERIPRASHSMIFTLFARSHASLYNCQTVAVVTIICADFPTCWKPTSLYLARYSS